MMTSDATEAPSQARPAPAVPGRRALAAAAAAAALAAALLAPQGRFILSIAARRGVDSWRGLTGAGLEGRVREFVGGLPAVREDLRLVVCVVDETYTAEAESPKRRFGVDLGTTRVSLSAPARVHYAIDLSDPRRIEFRVDPGLTRFVAVFPDPEVQAVELFGRDRRAKVEPGWGRLKAFSGRYLEDRLERGLYDEVRREASSPRALEAVRYRARFVLARFVADYLRRSGAWGTEDGFRELSIRFRGDKPDEETFWVNLPERAAPTLETGRPETRAPPKRGRARAPAAAPGALSMSSGNELE